MTERHIIAFEIGPRTVLRLSSVLARLRQTGGNAEQDANAKKLALEIEAIFGEQALCHIPEHETDDPIFIMSEDQLYLVCPWCSDGQLFDRWVEEEPGTL